MYDQFSLVNLPPISPSSSNENCPANKTDASAALEILERVDFYIFWLFHLASLILPFASSHLRVVGQSEELKELNKETWETLRGEKLKKEKGQKEGLKELNKATWES